MKGDFMRAPLIWTAAIVLFSGGRAVAQQAGGPNAAKAIPQLTAIAPNIIRVTISDDPAFDARLSFTVTPEARKLRAGALNTGSGNGQFVQMTPMGEPNVGLSVLHEVTTGQITFL